jgi:hypothetical protein
MQPIVHIGNVNVMPKRTILLVKFHCGAVNVGSGDAYLRGIWQVYSYGA